ncbi:MAG: hypothetical protein NVSMB9_14680 [Isosphaeraceae bacterium]
MTRPRSRKFLPAVTLLEARSLLSTIPTATWIGQDGHDLAGGAAPLAGNGVQDIHLTLAGLPADRSIASMRLDGYGGGGWIVNVGPYNSTFSGALIRANGATTADLYVDPYRVETGREFTIVLAYDNSSTDTMTMAGGVADPNLRMPLYGVTSQWIGQDGMDLTGSGVAVGPDGIQDVHVSLSHLFPATAINGVSVVDQAGRGWEFGINPKVRNNAEFLRHSDDPRQGDLYFNPDHDLSGQTLTVTVSYADGKMDHTTLLGGRVDPNLAMPVSAPPTVLWDTFRAHWIGQDGTGPGSPGDVHLALDGLPPGRIVMAATLSDQAGLDWGFTRPGSGTPLSDPYARPLGYQVGTDPTRADLEFSPGRSETGATLTLSLVLDDGRILATHFMGSACDPGLLARGIASSTFIAHPGDDLNDLVNRYGTVRLVAGLYPMSQPLVLSQPVTLTSDPGATLLFSQEGNAPAWSAAIKVRASHTTLDGFAVRFTGPVRWAGGVSYGPAVVGSTDNFDPWSSDPLVALKLTHLDLQAPPPSGNWEEAPELLRLTSAASGVISENRLKGGVTEFIGGPWEVTGNTYLGTLPGSFAYSAFASHYTHDVTIAGNLVAPSASSGKTWRFLVMTQQGFGDVVRDNTVVGVGPMDSDTVVNPNAAELLLTEAYRLHYEGLVSSVSSDGYVVRIPSPQAGQARTGDVLAILSGAQAGQWRTIAQVLSPTAYLLDTPITPGRFAVSLATGFVNETYQGNFVDSRGSSTVDNLVLAGNQFGARILGNHWIGGSHAFQLTAYPSETPNIWGWTHAPFLGATVRGNIVENTLHGGQLDVLHNPYSKTNAGRVYFSGSFDENRGVWSAEYLAARKLAGVYDFPTLLTIGDGLSADPGELVLTSSGNLVSGPSEIVAGPTFSVLSGTVNGLAGRNVGLVLSGPPAPSLNAAPVVSAAIYVGDVGPVLSGPPAPPLLMLPLAPEAVTSTMGTAPDVAPTIPSLPSRETGSGGGFEIPHSGRVWRMLTSPDHPSGPRRLGRGFFSPDRTRLHGEFSRNAGARHSHALAFHRTGRALPGSRRLSVR